MKSLLAARNQIEKYVKGHSRWTSYVLRTVLVFVCLISLRSSLNYNTLLSNVFIMLAFSVVCGFIPMRFLMLPILAYEGVQLFTLSIGAGIVAVVLLLIMYLVYFRFRKEYAMIIIIMPVLFALKGQVFLALLLAVTASMEAVVPILLGTVFYYIIHYIGVNATVFNSLAGTTEIAKMSQVIQGIFSYREMWASLVILFLVFMLTALLKRVKMNNADFVAIGLGGALFIILSILRDMAFATLTSARLIAAIVGALISMIVAILCVRVVLPLDFSRTEQLQFEDEEYYYYVRAIPKAAIEKETIRIKRINTRRKQVSERSKK